MKRVFVTGGCGFIGSNLLNQIVPRHPEWEFVNVDALTYAANPSNLEPIQDARNYAFAHVDLAQVNQVSQLFETYTPDWVLHLAAESHVDRSIDQPVDFVQTNVVGTFNLLEACRTHWANTENKLFLQVSTDEVFGELGPTGLFSEESPYHPSSPYSASKAAGDHLVRAYHRTYGLPVKLTHGSNTYGPYQFPEKLIPCMIQRSQNGEPLPVYGKGSNIRDWLHVSDHCEAIWAVARDGAVGESYGIGGGCERTNLEVVRAICDEVAKQTGADPQDLQSQISFVDDRPGHDFRYALNTTKIETQVNWAPTLSFEEGLRQTIAWYLSHPEWIEAIGLKTKLQA